MSEAKRLLVATTNIKKLKELRDLLVGMPFRCVGLHELPAIKVVEETGGTFRENAELKALGYAAQTGMLTLGEDSGLCVEALGGAPGVLSARFSGESKDDGANNRKLLRSLEGVPEAQRGAYYESVAAVAEPGRLIGAVSGRVRGVITQDLRGTGGFGYDPLFYYPPFGKTFGQVPLELKHSVSHRSVALAGLRDLLERYLAGSL
ncbi:MAG: RdgB/HAM1 family non-canonical purine NTP pyrophosphatase [Candidatus Omnitrophica bacterium]|nr:RdgB/HAM1 family non-canonical purine NTP pyrophosphatase [Candidatus Omnitrophota bacterium]